MKALEDFSAGSIEILGKFRVGPSVEQVYDRAISVNWFRSMEDNNNFRSFLSCPLYPQQYIFSLYLLIHLVNLSSPGILVLTAWKASSDLNNHGKTGSNSSIEVQPIYMNSAAHL